MMILEDWRFTSGYQNRCEATVESKKEGQRIVRPEQDQNCSDTSKEKEKYDGSNE
jgi:hypothetical protein